MPIQDTTINPDGASPGSLPTGPFDIQSTASPACQWSPRSLWGAGPQPHNQIGTWFQELARAKGCGRRHRIREADRQLEDWVAAICLAPDPIIEALRLRLGIDQELDAVRDEMAEVAAALAVVTGQGGRS